MIGNALDKSNPSSTVKGVSALLVAPVIRSPLQPHRIRGLALQTHVEVKQLLDLREDLARSSMSPMMTIPPSWFTLCLSKWMTRRSTRQLVNQCRLRLPWLDFLLPPSLAKDGTQKGASEPQMTVDHGREGEG